MIRAIDKSSIQKICSGQVVVDLATAVKEMVENALDSGATSVEVKLRDMGASYIEVSDNGSGIDPSNYDGIARKHFTSKLKDFEDIFSVSSFGFRGEALNALCELSGSFSITTKQAHQPVGANLQFDRNGGLLSQSVAARTNGTSVIVENLFDKLPVRRKDFVKSIKKHFQKMVRVVQSYALISVGVKIIVTNTTTSLTATGGPGGTSVGSKQTVFATQSGGKLTDNVSILFGAKFASSLLPIDFSVQLGKSPHTLPASASDTTDESEEHLENELDSSSIEFSGFSAEKKDYESTADAVKGPNIHSSHETDSSVPDMTEDFLSPNTVALLNDSSSNKVCTVRGLVSKVGLGVGRSDNDRQFTFCNGRPVDLPRFAKALNEVWRKYEMKQKPAFVLDISVPAGYFDVNLTPDKREVLIVQEAAILEQLREVVDVLYAPVRQTMPLNQGMAGGVANSSWASMFSSETSPGQDTPESAPTARNLIQSALADYLVSPVADSTPLIGVSSAPQRNVISLEGVSKEQDFSFGSSSGNLVSLDQQNNHTSQFLHSTPVSSTPSLHAEDFERTGEPLLTQSHKREAVVWMSELERERLTSSPIKRVRTSADAIYSPTPTPGRALIISPSQLTASSADAPLLFSVQPEDASVAGSAAETQPMELELTTQFSSEAPETQNSLQEKSTDQVQDEVEYVSKTNVWAFDVTAALERFKQRRALARAPATTLSPVCIAATENQTDATGQTGVQGSSQGNSQGEDVFQIDEGTLASGERTSTPSSTQTSNADRQQARILHKKDFPRMRILGQFNLGFVIAELDGDLYILDQHACDEKYRFELLQRTTQIHQQPLIHPLTVETSAALELVMAENIPTFTRNGFKLSVDLAATSGGRVKLHSVPFSKSVRFGVDDVNELASMISEHHRGGGGDGSSDATSERTSKNYLMLKNDSLALNTHISTSSSSTNETNSLTNDERADGETRNELFRLPKLVAMYASRACRSAIMIGTALHERDMQRVVSRLEHVEQPWNCPHGRPTLRHLVDLTPLREHSSHRTELTQANTHTNC